MSGVGRRALRRLWRARHKRCFRCGELSLVRDVAVRCSQCAPGRVACDHLGAAHHADWRAAVLPQLPAAVILTPLPYVTRTARSDGGMAAVHVLLLGAGRPPARRATTDGGPLPHAAGGRAGDV
eukprot:363893-Chlamydomonas_euryale.AAC.6